MDDADLNRIARSYVAAFRRDGVAAHIANLDTSVTVQQWGEHVLPVTVNNGEAEGTFVCSPRVGYIDYIKEELARFPEPHLARLLGFIVALADLGLKPAHLQQIVHINNWMLSTNPMPGLDPALVSLQTRELAERHPSHFLAMRSLNWPYHGELMKALEAEGWVLLPSRQIYLLDDVAKQISTRRDCKRDERLSRDTPYKYEILTDMRPGDTARIAELYALLYLDKYSRLNPAFTSHFINTTHEIGMLRYLVFRDETGVIQSFGAMLHYGDFGTMPMVGYDTSVGQRDGLFRLAFHAGSRYAASHGLRFNMSSGATGFKIARGASAEMEFTAFYNRHLPLRRQLPLKLFRWIAFNIGIPILRKYEL